MAEIRRAADSMIKTFIRSALDDLKSWTFSTPHFIRSYGGLEVGVEELIIDLLGELNRVLLKVETFLRQCNNIFEFELRIPPLSLEKFALLRHVTRDIREVQDSLLELCYRYCDKLEEAVEILQIAMVSTRAWRAVYLVAWFVVTYGRITIPSQLISEVWWCEMNNRAVRTCKSVLIKSFASDSVEREHGMSGEKREESQRQSSKFEIVLALSKLFLNH
jgi:hypothetical protein